MEHVNRPAAVGDVEIAGLVLAEAIWAHAGRAAQLLGRPDRYAAVRVRDDVDAAAAVVAEHVLAAERPDRAAIAEAADDRATERMGILELRRHAARRSRAGRCAAGIRVETFT